MSLAVRPKTSDIVTYQLPDHVQTAQKLVAFLKYYYQWTELDGNSAQFLSDLSAIKDIDRTTDVFVDKLILQMARFVPKSADIDRKFLAKHIRDFFDSKGSLVSYEFILQALFGEEMTKRWMGDSVLKASESDFGYDTIIPISVTSGSFHDAGGSFLRGVRGIQAKISDVVKTVSTSGKEIELILLENASTRGEFTPNMQVTALKSSIPASYYEVVHYYDREGSIESYYTPQSGTTPARLVIYSSTWNFPSYENLIVRQLETDFRAVVESASTSEILNRRIVTLNLKLDSVTGSIDNSKQFYLISSFLEPRHYTKTDFVTGVVDYAVTSVVMQKNGSLYYSGLPITVSGGSGVGLSPYISEVGTGGVNGVEILNYGKGYVVGDEIISAGLDSGGNGFAAHVSNVDGIGASILGVLELDEIVIRDGGSGFEVGDKFEFTYDSGRYKSVSPIRITVNSVQTSGSRSLNGVRITNVGSGYRYVKFALSANGGAPVAGFTFNVKTYPTSDPLKQSEISAEIEDIALTNYLNNKTRSSYIETTYASYEAEDDFTTTSLITLPSGAIYDVIPTATTVVPAGTITLHANGYGATLTPTVNGNGSITSVAVTTGGYNYVDPIVKVVGDGYGAVLYATKNTNGTITGITVGKGGVGYTGALSVVVVERYGSNFSAEPIIGETVDKGSILSFTIDSRGEYTTLPDVQKIRQSTKTTPSYLKYLPTGSAPYGVGAVLDFEFKMKRLELLSGGRLYNTAFDYYVPGGDGNGIVNIKTNSSGGISGVTVVNAGTGFTNGTVSVVPGEQYGYVGPGTGGSFDITVTTGKISAISNIVAGTGYYPTNIVFTGCHGSGASFDLILDGGELAYVRVLDGGSAYSSQSFITFSGTYTVQPTATLVIEKGRIISVNITNAGSGITDLAYTVSYPGTMESAHPIIEGNGGIKQVVVTNGGSGYYAVDEIIPLTLVATAAPIGGATAELLPLLDADGNIIGVNIVDPGAGYLVAPSVTVNGGYVVGGVQPTPPSITTTIFDGHIVEVSVGGTGDPGFKYGTDLHVNGTGSGATLTPVINSGIDAIRITAGGSYTANSEVDVTVGDSDIATVLPGITLVPSVITLKTNSSGEISSAIIRRRGTHHITPYIDMDNIPGLAGTGGALSFTVTRNIESVIITTPGEKYTSANVVVVGDGEGATAELTLDKSGVVASVVVDGVGSNITRPPVITVVDQSNYGAISAIRITDSGSGYVKTPLVYVGEGIRQIGSIDKAYSGATLVATSNSIGSIRAIDFVEFGCNYVELPKLTTPISVIVDSVFGFKVGEVVRTKGYKYYSKNILQNIATVTGTGAGATIQLKTPSTPTEINKYVVLTGDLGIEIGMPVEIHSTDTIASGTFNVVSIQDTSFTVEFNNGINYTGPITIDEAKINSDKFGPHGILRLIDVGRRNIVLVDATERSGITTQTSTNIVSESGLRIVTEDSFDMNHNQTFLGATTGATANPVFNNRASIAPVSGAVGTTERKYKTERGRINTKSVRIGDNDQYQDYAYVISTGLQVNDYKSALEATVHPAGFKMFGETVISKVIQLPIPKTPSSLYSQFISLIFSLAPASVYSEYASDINTPERRYHQRFMWESNDINTYDIGFNLFEIGTESYDFNNYDVTGKYLSTNEVYDQIVPQSFSATYIHNDTFGGYGSVIQCTKVGHNLVANDTVWVKHEYIDGTFVQTGSTVEVTKAGHNLQSNTFIELEFSGAGGELRYGAYHITVTGVDTFEIESQVADATSGTCKYKLVDEACVVDSVAGDIFYLTSRHSTVNITGTLFVYKVDAILAKYATSRNEDGYFRVELLGQTCSATGSTYNHTWDGGYDFGGNNPIPSDVPLNANLLTIDLKEVDAVTGDVIPITHGISVRDYVFIKNLVPDSVDFSDGILTDVNAYQQFQVYSKTDTTITVFLQSAQILGTETGVVDVMFNASYITK